jgi:hypothetical protein
MKKLSTVEITSFVVGVFGWIISLSSIFRTGVGWDSVFDLNAAKISLENSKSLDIYSYYDLVPITSEFYGTFIYKIADWLSIQMTSNSIFDDTTLLSGIYFVDLTTWLISLFSVIVVSISLYVTFGSRKFSLLFFGLVSTLPIWVGMSQVNSKDVPVAAGLSIFSAGFMLILKKSKTLKVFYWGIFLTSIGAGISLAVRPASIVLVLAFLSINVLVFFLSNLRKEKLFSLLVSIFLIYFTTLLISLAIMYISNPISINNFYTWVLDAVRTSLNYPSIQPIKVFGQDFLSNELPPWYVFAWVWAQLPVLTFLSLLASLILLIKRVAIFKDLSMIYSISPFLIQAFLVPLIMLFTQNNIYNGIRHLLFIYPALMIVSTIFLLYLVKNFDSKFFRTVSKGFVISILLLNAFATYRWLPYSYAYINPLAGFGAQRNWDLDYWGLTSREGIKRLEDKDSTKNVFVMPDASSSLPFGGQGITDLTSVGSPFSLYVFIHWNHKIVEDNCEIEFRIKRDNQVLGMGGFCNGTNKN